MGSTVAAAVDAYGDPGRGELPVDVVRRGRPTARSPGRGDRRDARDPAGAAEGRHLQVRLALAPQGFAAATELERSPLRGPVAAAAPPVAVPAETPAPTVTPTPAPIAPAKTFADEAAELATAGLGAGARFAPRVTVGGGAPRVHSRRP